jgi:asparagine synthase (glutamine-hydrolysing)
VTGLLGWWNAVPDDPDGVVERMSARMQWGGVPERRSVTGPGFALAAVGAPGTVGVLDAPDVKVVVHGHPRWRGTPRQHDLDACAAALADAWRSRGADSLSMLGGDFAVALVDQRAHRLMLATDRMGVRNLAWQRTGEGIVFAGNLDALGEHPAVVHRIAPQALYDYLYFHMVPGPATAYERSERLLPGHRIAADSKTIDVVPYWTMAFDEVDTNERDMLAHQFREALVAGVEACALPRGCGTFLSGGTDSSTITALLGRQLKRPVHSFSIGFAAEGYDEMSYARIAARAFGSEHHTYYVTPDDVASMLPWIATAYDEPFGNASAVPAYFCARLAHDAGIVRMLAGDGGDELFGGNSRYGRQQQFELYSRVPSALRAMLEPVLQSGFAGRVPLLRKARSYIAQATMSMPARYESYNLLERLDPVRLLEPDFLASVDRARPLAMLTEWWHRTPARSLVNRMLALDFKFTLADSDLPKVTRACDRAGVDVAFPLLDDDVVALSGRVPPRGKVSGTTLRPFFKHALRDVLPGEIIAKQKHGFGLPTGPWLASHPALNAILRETMDSLGRRGIVRRGFIDELITHRLAEHAGYYGTMLWILMTLELWLARVDREASDRLARAALNPAFPAPRGSSAADS